MWLVTGDTHGLTGYDAQKIYPNYLKAIGINIDDIEGIIICGDFGGIWKGTKSEIEYSVKKRLGSLQKHGLWQITRKDGQGHKSSLFRRGRCRRRKRRIAGNRGIFERSQKIQRNGRTRSQRRFACRSSGNR